MPRLRHDPSKNFVGFLVGDVTYAVHIETVREIVNPLPVVALPHAAKFMRGVADYRGVVVAVVDLRERFGLPPAVQTRKSKWIIVDASRAPRKPGEPLTPPSRAAGRFVALSVDAVTEVFGSGGAELRPAPPLGEGDDLRGIAGVTANDRSLVFVLDVRTFLAAADIADSIAPPPLQTKALVPSGRP